MLIFLKFLARSHDKHVVDVPLQVTHEMSQISQVPLMVSKYPIKQLATQIGGFPEF
jgi:hypothetical protein